MCMQSDSCVVNLYMQHATPVFVARLTLKNASTHFRAWQSKRHCSSKALDRPFQHIGTPCSVGVLGTGGLTGESMTKESKPGPLPITNSAVLNMHAALASAGVCLVSFWERQSRHSDCVVLGRAQQARQSMPSPLLPTPTPSSSSIVPPIIRKKRKENGMTPIHPCPHQLSVHACLVLCLM